MGEKPLSSSSSSSSLVDQIVVAGDVILDLSNMTNQTLKLGPGLRQDGDAISVMKAGRLRFSKPNKYWVESIEKRYVPCVEDTILGIVVDCKPDNFLVDIKGPMLAFLPVLAFEGGTRRNIPKFEYKRNVLKATQKEHRQSPNTTRKSKQRIATKTKEKNLQPDYLEPMLPGNSLFIQKEASTAKYIVHQYIAATGGQAALSSVNSYYAIGKVRMSASEFQGGDESVHLKRNGDIGGFVLWQKNPDLWSLELVVSGCKVTHMNRGKRSRHACSVAFSRFLPQHPLHAWEEKVDK